MITFHRTLTVSKNIASLNEPIYMFRGDGDILLILDLIQTIRNMKFGKVSSTNVITDGLIYSTVCIYKPSGELAFVAKGEIVENQMQVTLLKDVMDEVIEIGEHKLQIHLFDEDENRLTLPEVGQIYIAEPLCENSHTAIVGSSTVGACVVANDPVTLADGYLTYDWQTGEYITSAKLNNMIMGIDEALSSISRMTFLENMVAEVEADLEGLHAKDEELSEQLANIENNSLFSEEITVNTSDKLIEAIENDNYTKITLRKGVYNIDGVLEINKHIDGKGSTIEVNSPFTTSGSTKLENISFKSISTSNNCIDLKGGCKIENCTFSSFNTAINQVGICVHGYVKNCTFQYNKNGIWLSCPGDTSMNNFIIENNYFVKHGENADDLSANGTKDDMVGIGLYLNGGCNHVVIRENVFEYNTFCGIYVTNTSMGKTNDSKIISNYFEGNKITSIYVKFAGASNNQFIIRDSFYAPKMTSNSDYIRDDIVLDSSNYSFNTIYGKRNIQILGTGTNLIFATDRSYFSFASQYISIPFDRVFHDIGSDECLVYMRYTTKLNSDVTFRDGNDTSLVLHTFGNSDGAIRTAIVTMPKNVNKYLNRALADDEYIRIYEYRIL